MSSADQRSQEDWKDVGYSMFNWMAIYANPGYTSGPFMMFFVNVFVNLQKGQEKYSGIFSAT